MEADKQKVRLRFEKTGAAAFISHLDLMRVLGRAMSRAEIPAVKTNGFNPHAYLSVSCALSLGYEGFNEMADIGLPQGYDPAWIPEKMNAVMPRGIRITEAYVWENNAKEIGTADYRLTFQSNLPYQELCDVLKKKPLNVIKKSKRSEEEKDISSMILSLKAEKDGISARLLCSMQENLNPRLLVTVLENARPDLKISGLRYARGRFYTRDGKEFR